MTRTRHLFSLIATLLLILSLALAACAEEEATPTPPAEVEEATPTAEAVEAATSTPTEETQPEAEDTATATAADTEAMTETPEVAGTAEITDTSELTVTTEITATVSAETALTDTAGLTDTTEITSTAAAETDIRPGRLFGVREASGILIRGTDFLGSNVENLAGQSLGEIEDAVIDLTDGGIFFANLSYGGFLDLGDEIFPVPLNALRWNPTFSTLILDVPEETLENAPGFEEDWPDLTDPRWDVEVEQFWQESDVGVALRRSTTGGVRSIAGTAIKASDLLGRVVRTPEDEELGEIEDLIIDLDDGDVAYTVMSFGGFLDIGEDLFAIPLNAFELDVFGPEGYEADLILDITEEQLQVAPRLEGDWPDTTDPNWDAEIRDFWGLEMQEEQFETAPRAITEEAVRETIDEMGIAGTLVSVLGINTVRPVRFSNFIGTTVESADGEPLAQIDDVVVGIDRGRVDYVILSPAEGTGSTGEIIAVPAGVLLLEIDSDTLILNADPETLAEAPRIEAEAWPGFVDAALEQEIFDYWSAVDSSVVLSRPPVTTSRTVAGLPPRSMAISNLFSRSIVNRDGEEIGQIEDVIFAEGNIRYVAISLNDDETEGQVVLPVYALIYNGAEDRFILDTETDVLRNAPHYTEATWPDLTQPDWDANIVNYWDGVALPAQPGVRRLASTTMRTSALIGYEVVDEEQEVLGNIEDLLIDLNSGTLRYAILSFGGFLEFGENQYAIPLNELKIDPYSLRFATDITEERLEGAPVFDPEAYATAPGWEDELNTFWGTEIETEVMTDTDAMTGTGTVIRLSELLDYEVIGPEGESIADLEDMLIDFLGSKASHYILEVGGFLGIGEKAIAVPFSKPTINTAEGFAQLDATAEMLEEAPEFESALYPQAGNNLWREEADAYWTE